MKHPSEGSTAPYTLQIKVQDGFVRCKVSGENTPETIRVYLLELVQRVHALGIKRVLIAENLSGPSIGEMEVYKLLRTLRQSVNLSFDKVAFVDLNPEHRGDIKFTETVAQNRGLNVRVHNSVQEQLNGWKSS